MSALSTYLGSKELKKLIVKRSLDLRLPLKLICMDLDINYLDFMRSYINSSENKTFKIEEEKFEGLLGSLGINVRHQFVIDTNFDAVAKQDYLREMYNKK